MGTPSSVFLGTRPPIYTMKFGQWLISLAKYRLAECPLVRTTRKYFVYNASGNGTGNGGAGTFASPYQCATPAHLDTLIRSVSGTNGDVRCSLRRGDVWIATNGGTAVVLDVPNVTLDDYSDGTAGHTLADPVPLISGFMAAYGGSGWTQDGAVYWRAETNGLGWFRESPDPDMATRRLTTATTLANFKAATNAGCWVVDTTNTYGYGAGNKLVVNPRVAGAAPLSTSQVSVGAGCGVRVTKNGVRVHNIQCDGWGMTAGDDAQQYGFRSDVSGQDCCVFTNCKGYYNGKYHSAGHLLAGTGGITSFFNCSFGLCAESSGAATMLNFYSDNGGSEGLSWCNNITHGCLLDETYNQLGLGQGIYSHTASSVTYGQLVVYGTKGPAVGCKNGLFGGTSSGATSILANRDDEASLNTFFVNENYPEIYQQNGGGDVLFGGWATINGNYRYNVVGAMAFIGIQLANPTSGAGFEINTTRILDATKTTATPPWYFTFTNRQTTPPIPTTRWHSRIEARMNPGQQFSDEGNGNGVNSDTLINCVYSGVGTGIFALNIFLNQLPTATQKGCTGLIIGGMSTASAYNGTKNYTEVSAAEAAAPPTVASALAYQNAVGAHPLGWQLEYDQDWKPRTKLQSSAGPRNMGYTSESLLSLMTP